MVNFINGHKFVTLFYDPDINRFVDGHEKIVYDIFRIISPNQLMLFKESKHTCLIRDVSNTFSVSLIYMGEYIK